MSHLHLKEPLPNLASWTSFFLKAEIPVLESTALALEELRAKEDDVDAGMLAELIDSDPFMTMKVLAYVSAMRRNLESTQTETVVSSLVMMGVAPFFRAFGPQPTVQQHLADLPAALDALLALHASTNAPNAPLLVYGEACRLGSQRLAQARVTFKHIPYDVKAR